MSTRKQDKAIRKLQQSWQLSKASRQEQMQWLLRSLLVVGRQPSLSGAGFVLPTVVLLLLVVSLTVGALLVRSLSRTTQVMGEREQQEIVNAATPAIDRGKAKLERLFNDPDYPNGVPDENYLVDLMLDDALYTLKGETRLDISGDGVPDNAWTYQEENPKDPNKPTVIAYSILMDTRQETTGVNTQKSDDAAKAKAMLVRHGPLNPEQLNPKCLIPDAAGSEQGWFKDNTSTSFLRKNFQVNAVVLKKDNDQINKPFSTLEFQQDRRVDRANKWAAWFRNDLEIFPGPDFRLNGALSTEGSLILGSDNKISSHLISSSASCLYGTDGIEASEIALNDQVDKDGKITFQGQVISGSLRDNTFNDNTAKIYQSPTSFTQLAQANDSVKATVPTPILIALDPLALFTGNLSQSRNKNDLKNVNVRDKAAWEDNKTNTLVNGDAARVSSRKASKPPYLDDTYRADNRYGPNVSRERYGLIPDKVFPPGKLAGQTILATDNFFPVKNGFDKLTKKLPPPENKEDLGLDGYWERRARFEGLRVIVGQRLELGNVLLPPSNTLPTNVSLRPNEALQRRTLRDNLAAVQATAIYHHEGNPVLPSDVQKDFPIACMSTTVHPGTAETLKKSATFEEITFRTAPGSPDATWKSNFFSGRGTNGWEYEYNATDLATLADPNSPIQKALRNLAYFAGDPDGAYPPKQETPATTNPNITHPYFGLASFGDFSNLRRALASGPYANLSIADQSYVHTAACSLGMLADNIKALKDYDYTRNSLASDPIALLDDLQLELAKLVYTDPTNPTNNIPARSPLRTIQRLEEQAKVGSESQKALKRKLVQVAWMFFLKEQVELDRNNNFYQTPSLPAINSDLGTYVCSVPAATPNLDKLCPTRVDPAGYRTNDVQYQALYYIFPTRDHVEGRTTDPYIILPTVNSPSIPNLYKGVGSPTYIAANDNAALEAIRIPPKTIGGGGNWKLDTELVTAPNTEAPNYKQNERIRYVDSAGVASVYRVPFKDTALFNGREMMNVRVLNVDVDLLRKNKPNSIDTWLPKNGLVFAFREDAVREGGIARPEIGSWSNFVPVWLNNTEFGPPLAWRMNATPGVRRDPPLNQDSGISPKPIDYYPDPDRRPYGFRLKNGQTLERVGVDKFSGLSFISDNPIYIQGDFNLHQKGSVLIEEFTETLLDTWSNFYDRKTLNPDFAKDADSWRPAEILGDAITIISNNFCDGSIEDGIITAGNTNPTASLLSYGCADTGTGRTSYMNQNRPSRTGLNPTQWIREENPANTTNTNSSPIRISENGAPTHISTAYNTANDTYYNFGDGKPLSAAVQTRINAMLISGIVASRANQSFGGFHNFPRFLETWNGINLFLSGSFLQLNFSTSATAPFDQDAWEPTQTPAAVENINYYGPPNRLWGYDVGLQSRPAGPVSRRFTVKISKRSEFYKELEVDDEYIKNLRCATIPGKGKVDPKATCP